MLIYETKDYMTHPIYGGSGIADTLSRVFGRVINSDATRNLASKLAASAVSSAQNVGEELGKAGIKKIETAIINRGKKALAPTPAPVAPAVKAIINEIIMDEVKDEVKDKLKDDFKLTDINKILLGSACGAKPTKPRKAKSSQKRMMKKKVPGSCILKDNTVYKIEDLVKMNGSGLRLAA